LFLFLRIQIGSVEFVCIGRIDNYRLAFAGNTTQRWRGAAATIVTDSDANVWGCVWRIANEYSDELDRQEHSYHRLNGEEHNLAFIGPVYSKS
jgi:hypothetical protein